MVSHLILFLETLLIVHLGLIERAKWRKNKTSVPRNAMKTSKKRFKREKTRKWASKSPKQRSNPLPKNINKKRCMFPCVLKQKSGCESTPSAICASRRRPADLRVAASSACSAVVCVCHTKENVFVSSHAATANCHFAVHRRQFFGRKAAGSPCD